MSDLHLPVEVDAYSDPRWTRIEREVFSKLDESPLPQRRVRLAIERHRGLGWAFALAAATSLIVVLAHPWTGAHWSDRLRLETTDSVSQFTVGESSLTVAPRSLVMVGGDDEHGISVVLDRGKVTCEVAPRSGRPPFVVEAGDVRVRVIGTRFSVARDVTGTLVDVDRGVVEVIARGVVSTVREGQHWPADVAPAKSATPGTVPIRSDSQAPGPMLAPSGPSIHAAPSPRSRSIPAAGAAAPAATSVPAAPEEGDNKKTSAGAPVTPPPDPSAAPSPQQLFESAALVERTHPDDAAAAYRRLAGGATAWAPNALFALARLEADRGHRTQAASLLNEYLARYPHGFNSDDARSLLQRMR